MAKQSSLTSLTGANAAATDTLEILDVSDTTMAASGTNKQITRAELFSSTPPISVGGADAVISRYAAKQVMISGDGVGATTNAGIIAGYYGVSGYGAIWNSTVVPSSDNYIMRASATQVQFNAETYLALALGGSAKLDIYSTAGRGPSITAGTATTDVAALSVTRTNNNAAVAKGVEFNFTDTTSAAGFLPFAVRGGAAGATDLLTVSKSGQVAFGAPGEASGPSYIQGSNYRIEFLADGSTTARSGWSSAYGFVVPATRVFSWTPAANWALQDTALSRISAGVVGVGTGAAGSFAGTMKMTGLILDKTITAPGTTGAQTINKSAGRVNFAALATSLVVTNSLVGANSIIQCTAATADATGYVTGVVAAAGSFTIYVEAPTAEMAVNFMVTN